MDRFVKLGCGLLSNICTVLQKMVQFKCRRLRITLKAPSPSSGSAIRPLTSYMGNQTPAVEVGGKARKSSVRVRPQDGPENLWYGPVSRREPISCSLFPSPAINMNGLR